MVKQQPDVHQYHHYHHSDSSRSPSVCSLSLSPKTSSSVAATAGTAAASAAGVSSEGSTYTFSDIDPQLAQHVEYELGLTKKNGSGTRKNAWGNLSYAELISKAITTSAEQRLTLSEIYDWMIKYVPFFRNKVDRVSSAGWKVRPSIELSHRPTFALQNSIRHNLSLHNRFKRIQSEGTGKSSWWIINPDEKNPSLNGSHDTLPSSNDLKQPRRRLGRTPKASSTAPKRLRASRSALKASRTMPATDRPLESTPQQIPLGDIAATPAYDTQQWSSQLDSDTPVTHLYDHDLYSAAVNTPLASSNSTGGMQSTYTFDDVPSNYVSNTSSNASHNGAYSYQPHHFHAHHHAHQQTPHTLYQHHHGSGYEPGSTHDYYYHQPVLNDHHLLPMDSYHTHNGLTYPLPTQAQVLDPTDEQQHPYVRVHSTSSHSSTSSLSPPILGANNGNLVSSSSSASSSSSYSYPHKGSSLTGGHLHPTSNGTLTLYSHHHQHHSDIETLLQLNDFDQDNDDDDDEHDLSTLVHHHHGMIDDHHQLFAHNEPSTSILRTVLKRPIVGKRARVDTRSPPPGRSSRLDMHNQQV